MKKFGMKFTPETTRILAKLHPRPPRLNESDGGQADNKKLIKQALVELRKNPYAGTDLQEELYGFKSINKVFCIIQCCLSLLQPIFDKGFNFFGFHRYTPSDFTASARSE